MKTRIGILFLLALCMQPVVAQDAASSLGIQVKQGYHTTGRGNTDAVILCIDLSKCDPKVQATGIVFQLKGISRKEINRIKIYQTATPEFYATTDRTLLSSQKPIGQCIETFFAPSTGYLWLTVDVKKYATLGAQIDASLFSITYSADGVSKTVDIPSVIGDPVGEAIIFQTQSIVYAPTSDDCRYYRIPAMTLNSKGDIVVACDRRYNSNDDLGNHKIDVSIRRSTNGGRSWSAQQLIAVGDTTNSDRYGYGDPSLVKTPSGRLLCTMAVGQEPFFGDMHHIALSISDDGGLTWTFPRLIEMPEWVKSIFVASGKGLTTSRGVVMFATNVITELGSNVIENFVIRSKDDGENWEFTNGRVYRGGDESKLVELPDGNILCSIRLREARGFNLLTENGDVIRDPWRAKSLYSGNSCNADILLTPQGLIHTYLRHPSLRRDLSLAVSDDNGSNWRKIMSLQPEDAAYSTMTLLPNGDLGILYEDGSFSSGNGYAITFLTITKKQLAKMVRQSKKK